MSVVQAGLAFRAARPIDDFAGLLSRIYARDVEELLQPSLERFDPRQPGDVMLQVFHDACFFCNLDLGLRAIEGGPAEAVRLQEALGARATVLAFCHDDAHARHGYAAIADGRLLRKRMQTGAAASAQPGAKPSTPTSDASPRVPAAAPAVEQGAPQAWERRWLTASHFVEQPEAPGVATRRIYYLGDREILVPESELTARLLHDGLEALFGVCPWDTLITPGFRFYRVAGGGGEPDSPETPRAPAPRAPWWRRLWR
jgi:hypothetical protein